MPFSIKNSPYIDSSYYYHLSKVNWKIFGSLTFKSKSKRNNYRTSRYSRDYDFKHLLENTFYRLKIYSDDVPYFLRHEYSESRKYHLHFLIANHRKIDHLDPYDLAGDLTSCWKRDFSGPRGSNGTAVIEPYNKHKDGAKYVCKLNPGQDSSFFDDFHMSEPLKEIIKNNNLIAECNTGDDIKHGTNV
jgi:hypothetical protein